MKQLLIIAILVSSLCSYGQRPKRWQVARKDSVTHWLVKDSIYRFGATLYYDHNGIGDPFEGWAYFRPGYSDVSRTETWIPVQKFLYANQRPVRKDSCRYIQADTTGHTSTRPIR